MQGTDKKKLRLESEQLNICEQDGVTSIRKMYRP